MNRYINKRQTTRRSPFCLLCLLGLTLFAAPVAAQVFDSGPSDPALFDTVVNVPPDPDIDLRQSIGGDGLTTQLNVSDAGSVERFFNANSGGEVNISGGSIGSLFSANSGSEVNISGGSVGAFFDANDGSEVNVTGGSVGVGFSASSGSALNISGGSLSGLTAESGSVVNISGGTFRNTFNSYFSAFPGSEVNLVGSGFVLGGEFLDFDLTVGEAFTAGNRGVDGSIVLSGLLADGTAFSFNLNSNPPVFEIDGDYFDSDATVTVTLMPSTDVLLGDVNNSGDLTFMDISSFIAALMGAPSSVYLVREAADVDQNGEVNFLDIGPFVALFDQ